jgi:hypothetical protein
MTCRGGELHIDFHDMRGHEEGLFIFTLLACLAHVFETILLSGALGSHSGILP